MKKVLVGILILIPIIILLVVSLATNILFANAYIAVEKLTIKNVLTNEEAFDLSFQFDKVDSGMVDLADYVYADIYPQYANSYTLEWRIVGDIIYTDEKYENEYKDYLAERSELRKIIEEEVGSGEISDEHKEAYDISFGKYYYDTAMVVENMLDLLLEVKHPAVALVDDNGGEADINTSGKLNVHSYCNFTLELSADSVSKTLSISIVGYDVEQVVISVPEGEDDTLGVGQSMRLLASYTPIQSIVNETIWSSSNNKVATVDENGVVKAVGVGKATIKLQASIYSSESTGNTEYVSGEFEIEVISNGASSIFGSKLVTSRVSLYLEEIGLAESEIKSVENCKIEDGVLTITGDNASVTLVNGHFSIVKCLNDAIVIENSDFFDKKNGYVLSVGENTLKLNVVWSDMLNDGDAPEVTWESSDESIATVDLNTGVVTGVGDGVVEIRVYHNGSVCCSIQLNVRRKLSSIQLRTSDESLAIGLAKETVVASQRYETSDKGDNTKIANSVYVIVQGQPNTDDEDLLKAFYAAYDFEITSGSEYAYFDDVEVNKLIFKQTLEGKGKQNIVVRVKAKYPKYETNTRFTEEDVTIKAVFGVEVNDIVDARRAVSDQKDYAMAEGNIIDGSLTFEHYNAQNNDRYFARSAPKSKQLYAMVFASSFGYEYGYAEFTISYSNQLLIFGDVYGNNNIFSAKRQQVEDHLFRVMWSGVTISNCVFRANDIGKEGSITSAEDTTGFSGVVCEVISWENDENGQGGTRVEDVKFEYSVFENATTGISIFNSDVEIKGCIIRNLTKAGIYAPARMIKYGEGYAPWYVHLDLHNVICSNTLGSFMSVAYETYTVKSGSKGYVGRFVENDLAKNEEYFMENFYNKGINIEVNQTGFLETYNWQNLENARLISTGTFADDLIASVAGELIGSLSAFDAYKYVGDKEEYIHLGFIVSGVDIDNGILDAPNYLKLNMQDDRFREIDVAKTINWKELKNADTLVETAAELLSQMTVKMYCYDNQCALTPFSTYQVNAALVNRLHGN